LPHSAISGSPRVCHSPELLAAYHGLHRLCVPRHPPHAFFRLTTIKIKQKYARFHRNLPIPFDVLRCGLRRRATAIGKDSISHEYAADQKT
jgi:hypothetical protein